MEHPVVVAGGNLFDKVAHFITISHPASRARFMVGYVSNNLRLSQFFYYFTKNTKKTNYLILT